MTARGPKPRSRPQTIEWLIIGEVCEVLRLSQKTVRNKIASGELPAYRPGSTPDLRFKRSDVEGLMRRVPTATAS